MGWSDLVVMVEGIRERPGGRRLRNTIASYRDALRQLLEYVVDKGLSPDTLHVEEITPDLITGFLLYLEQTKNCSIQTRNLRLSAIHGFAGYISTSEPQYLFWYTKLKAIPIKRRGPKEQDEKAVPEISYLEKDEMKTLLSIPDRDDFSGHKRLCPVDVPVQQWG